VFKNLLNDVIIKCVGRKKLGTLEKRRERDTGSILEYLNYAVLRNKMRNATVPRRWKSGSVNLEMTLVKNKTYSTSRS
jgi:hypothetical protein